MKRTKFAIMLIGFRSYLLLGLSAIIAKLAADFPLADITQIQMVMTLPSLVGIPTVLTLGVLMSRVRKKPLALICLFISIFAVLPLFFYDSFGLLLAASVFLGLSNGVNSIASSMINEHFEGHERHAMTGIYTGMGQLGGVVFSLVGGVLASRHWHYLYTIFLIGVPVFIVAVFCLPRGKAPIRVVKTEQNSSGFRKIGSAVIYIILVMVYMSAIHAVALNNSLLLTEKGFDSTALAGLIVAVMTGSGAILGLMYGPLCKLLGRFILPFGALVPIVGFILLALSKNLVLYAVGSVFIGTAISIQLPASIMKCSEIVPETAVPFTISLVLVAQYMGNSLSAVGTTAIADAFGLTSAEGKMLVCGVVMGLLFVIYLVLSCRKKRTTDVRKKST